MSRSDVDEYVIEYKLNHNGIRTIAVIVPSDVKLWLEIFFLSNLTYQTYAKRGFPLHKPENRFKIADPGHVPWIRMAYDCAKSSFSFQISDCVKTNAINGIITIWQNRPIKIKNKK